MTAIVLDVIGLPTPQGSKKAFVDPRGHARMTESSNDRLKLWRQDVKAAACDYIGSREGTGDPFATLGEPLSLTIVFRFERPKGHYRTGRNAHLLRDGAPTFPDTGSTGDVDKLIRSTLDALAIAGMFANDKQVAHVDAWKVYLDEPGVRPGARIEIRVLDDDPYCDNVVAQAADHGQGALL